MQIYWTKINKIKEEASEVKTYLLDCPKDFEWEEGAHTHLAMKGFNAGDKPNRSLVRHMSISTLPYEGSIGITTRIKEQCSEYKSILGHLKVGDEVALFKTGSNVTLKRENKPIYLLSSGVGLATFRPLVLDYLKCPDNITHLHSLNIESSKQYLFTDVFKTAADKQFKAQFVGRRQDYYEEVKNLAEDKEGLFYVAGSDDFLKQNIDILLKEGISTDQIVLDKHPQQQSAFI